MLTLSACISGLYLGLKFNILALLPFSLLGAGAYVALSCSNGSSLLHSLSAVLVPLVAVQFGYFLGLTARHDYRTLLTRFRTGQSRQA